MKSYKLSLLALTVSLVSLVIALDKKKGTGCRAYSEQEVNCCSDYAENDGVVEEEHFEESDF